MHKGEIVRVTASGRTDAGVHATGQVIHFDTTLSFLSIAMQRALNVQLPEIFECMSVEEVSE